jgi:hypothetical protein
MQRMVDNSLRKDQSLYLKADQNQIVENDSGPTRKLSESAVMVSMNCPGRAKRRDSSKPTASLLSAWSTSAALRLLCTLFVQGHFVERNRSWLPVKNFVQSFQISGIALALALALALATVKCKVID